MIEQKPRKARVPEGEVELPPEVMAEGERIAKQYSRVLKALAKH